MGLLVSQQPECSNTTCAHAQCVHAMANVPLMGASTHVVIALLTSSRDCLVCVLLVYQTNNAGNTAMHLACMYGHVKVLEAVFYFMEANSATELLNRDGNKTPRQLAVENGRFANVW